MPALVKIHFASLVLVYLITEHRCILTEKETIVLNTLSENALSTKTERML